MVDKSRRQLAFANFDEVVHDIEQLASGLVTVSGNHSFAEIVRHLALTNEMAAGKIQPPKPPLAMRMVLMIMKPFILSRDVTPGIKLPRVAEEFFWSNEEITIGDAIDQFKDSVKYYQEFGPLKVHPIFGKASSEQITRLTLSHAAMHLSFVHRAE